MRGQTSQFDCGAAALHNALWALGLEVTLHDCEEACGSDQVEGTPVKKLKAGIKAMGGVVLAEVRDSKEDVALLRLQNHLDWGRPVILVVDGGNHWVTAIGTLGDRFLVADGEDNELVRSFSEGELLQRWCCPDERPRFYGVAVGLNASE